MERGRTGAAEPALASSAGTVRHSARAAVAHVQSYITRKIRKDEIANNTANHILTAIKAFLHYCVKHEYLGRNPAVAVERLKVPKIPGKHLSLDEIHRLLETAKQDQDGRFHPMIAIAIHAGLRLGELFALEWKDVDFKRKPGYDETINKFPT